MKLRYLLPFYALLVGISFCCRKISDEKEEAAKNEKQEAVKTMAATSAQPITGTLELDERSGTIYADLYINVPNADFKYDEDFMPLQTSEKFKGITFRYHDAVNNTRDDGNGSVPLHVTFNFKNTNKWVENDSVRVMSLDEDTEAAFTSLKPYFESRMDHFKNSVTTYSALVLFNEDWNKLNPDNKVNPGGSANSNTPQKNFTPRITRDDSILSLKVKK